MFNPFMSGLGMFGGYGGYRPPMPPMMGSMFGSPFGGMMGGYQRPSFGRPPMMGGFGGFGGYGSPFGGLGMFGMSPYGGMPNYGMFGGMMNPFMNRPLQQSPDAIINDGGGALLSATEGVMPAPGAPVNNRLPQFNYGKEQAEMRMMQRDLKSAEEQAYINKVLGYEAAPIRTDTNPTFTNELPQQPTDLMAGFKSSEFALPPNAITDMAMGNVGLADGRNFRFGSMAEAGAFRNYLDSIGQKYNNANSNLSGSYGRHGMYKPQLI
tara:strand:+ start:106 stop:903 length:798 start_codon:yes stop_codon:yes gene_type:complete